MFWRWGVLYPLYALAEIGIIFTGAPPALPLPHLILPPLNNLLDLADLAELIGSAIAINLCVRVRAGSPDAKPGS